MSRPLWGTTPRASIEAECARRGREQVVLGCRALLAGGEADAELVAALAGPTAPRLLEPDRGDRYWLRVWGARGLLWAWDDSAAPDICAALRDDAWRVREMALKVIARNHVDACLEELLAVREDDVRRVRAAAASALVALTSGGTSHRRWAR
jgi:HEAT repeat protein